MFCANIEWHFIFAEAVRLADVKFEISDLKSAHGDAIARDSHPLPLETKLLHKKDQETDYCLSGTQSQRQYRLRKQVVER